MGSDTSERGQVVLAHPNLPHCSGGNNLVHQGTSLVYGSTVVRPPTPGVTPSGQIGARHGQMQPWWVQTIDQLPPMTHLFSAGSTDVAAIAEQLLPVKA